MSDLNNANTSYPASLDTYTPLADGVGVNLEMAQHQNGPNSAIIAMQTEMGIGLKGSKTDLASRLSVLLNLLGAINGGNAFPTNPNPADGQLFWRNDLKQFYIYDGGASSWRRIDGVSDHSLLGNLLVDTHTQYLDVAGTRPAPVIQATNGLGLKGGTANLMTLTGTPTAPRTITIPDATDTLVNLASIQTLLNKIFTSPTINGGIINGGTLNNSILTGTLTGTIPLANIGKTGSVNSGSIAPSAFASFTSNIGVGANAIYAALISNPNNPIYDGFLIGIVCPALIMCVQVDSNNAVSIQSSGGTYPLFYGKNTSGSNAVLTFNYAGVGL